MTKKGEEKQNIEIAVIREKITKVEKWIDNADVNHFPTIDKRFNDIEKKLAMWSGAIIILGILIPKLLDKIF